MYSIHYFVCDPIARCLGFPRGSIYLRDTMCVCVGVFRVYCRPLWGQKSAYTILYLCVVWTNLSRAISYIWQEVRLAFNTHCSIYFRCKTQTHRTIESYSGNRILNFLRRTNVVELDWKVCVFVDAFVCHSSGLLLLQGE